MKVGIIIPYFGKLPAHFQIFLNSCAYNSGFDWIIFTDDSVNCVVPKNVHIIQLNFLECKKLAQSKFDFEIELNTPHKLCDFKPAYGLIFEEYITEFDWWGYCDLDQVFGNLSYFITEEDLKKYEKIYSLGHLTLYHNTFAVNNMFRQKLNGRERYREVFTTDIGCAFDEWWPENINEIFIESKLPVKLENDCADIQSSSSAFHLLFWNLEKRKYIYDNKKSIFCWRNGHIYQIYREHGNIKEREFAYVHLQKRQMKDKRKDKNNAIFYIVPNSFVDGDYEPQKLLVKCFWKTLINTQFFKVKWKSFKARVKMHNWDFSKKMKIEKKL